MSSKCSGCKCSRIGPNVNMHFRAENVGIRDGIGSTFVISLRRKERAQNFVRKTGKDLGFYSVKKLFC
jgi:hypothetical protein